jgi:2-polyprenyl-3-methyl-5-hydroxy-6-metoxy-1,4-benzoquinol methylase
MVSAVANLHAPAAGRSRFNDEAATWDSRPFVHEASREASKAIIGHLGLTSSPDDGRQVLEIGCGTGILSFLLAAEPTVKRIVAVDAAPAMIDVLRAKLAHDPVARAKILPLACTLEDPEDPALPPADDGRVGRQKFDLVTSHLVLHHVPDLRAVLTTMHGCLKTGGCVMLTDFEDFGPDARSFHPASKMDGVARHGIHSRTMIDLMVEVGFELVKVMRPWRMAKTVEAFDGEFGEEGCPRPGSSMGKTVVFPFVLVYAMKTRNC